MLHVLRTRCCRFALSYYPFLCYSGFPRSWKILEKKLSWKVMENLLKIESHEILLKAERKFFFKLIAIPVSVT